MIKLIHLIHGLPGTGKTAFARKLAAETGAILLNHDEVRVAVFGSTPPSERFEEYTERINALIWSFAEKFVQRDIAVILDHGFWTRASRDQAKTRAIAMRAEPRFYEMVCAPSVADARVLKRNETLEPGTLFIPPGALDIFRSRFEPMTPDEERVTIHTDRPNPA